MREKLIELIANFRGCPDGRNPFEGDICRGCKYEHSVDCVNENLADHLIANGVTMQRWIPVTERLPTWADGNKYGGILAVRRGHELSDFYHCNDVKENPDDFTHWMPLPTSPKDGE